MRLMLFDLIVASCKNKKIPSKKRNFIYYYIVK